MSAKAITKAKTYVDKKGYLRFSDSDKYVHIWAAHKKYPGIDFNGKEVHHIDGDKKNNDQDNLILLSKKDHWLLHKHKIQQDKLGRWRVTGWAWAFIILATVLAFIPIDGGISSGVLLVIALAGGVSRS